VRELGKIHPQFFEAADNWYCIVEKANWHSFHDVKKVFNSVDCVGNDLYIFNVRGNKLRIIARVLFRVRTVYIKFIGTHAEYDKVDLSKLWKTN
jgi:mRNA interferase HigB